MIDYFIADFGAAFIVGDDDGARRVCLQCESRDVVPLALDIADQDRIVLLRFILYSGLGFAGPLLILLEAALGFADGGGVGINSIAIYLRRPAG